MMLVKDVDDTHPVSSYGVDSLTSVEVPPVDHHIMLLLDRTTPGHAVK